MFKKMLDILPTQSLRWLTSDLTDNWGYRTVRSQEEGLQGAETELQKIQLLWQKSQYGPLNFT